jgi:hypothetical protein
MKNSVLYEQEHLSVSHCLDGWGLLFCWTPGYSRDNGCSASAGWIDSLFCVVIDMHTCLTQHQQKSSLGSAAIRNRTSIFSIHHNFYSITITNDSATIQPNLLFGIAEAIGNFIVVRAPSKL